MSKPKQTQHNEEAGPFDGMVITDAHFALPNWMTASEAMEFIFNSICDEPNAVRVNCRPPAKLRLEDDDLLGKKHVMIFESGAFVSGKNHCVLCSHGRMVTTGGTNSVLLLFGWKVDNAKNEYMVREQIEHLFSRYRTSILLHCIEDKIVLPEDSFWYTEIRGMVGRWLNAARQARKRSPESSVVEYFYNRPLCGKFGKDIAEAVQ